MTTTIFRNVHLLAPESAEGMSSICDLKTQNGKIAEISESITVTSGDSVIEGDGRLLMPGLVNGHFHSSVNHMKGRLPGLPLEIFMLYECLELEILRPTPREAYLRTMLGCMEMLECGTTAVQDDCFFVPEPEPDVIDAVVQAYTDSGMRVRIALDQPEVSELEKLPYLADMVPDELRRVLAEPARLCGQGLLEQYRHLLDRWHNTGNGRIQAAVSCSAPQRVTPEYFEALDDLSKTHDLPFYAHMLETKTQRVLGIEKYGGRSLVRYTNDLGLLSERMNIIHAIWIDEADMDLIAEQGAKVAHNPISNLRLGSGIMPFRALAQRGIPICLGVDEAIADDAINMWSVVKLAGMVHALSDRDYRRWPQAKEILAAATTGGGRAMRVSDLGELKVGAPADLILVDLNALPFLPLNNLVRQLVHCELGRSVELVMVEGRIVARNGRITTVDRGALLEEARDLFQQKSAAINKASEVAGERLGPYLATYDKAMGVDVGIERRLPFVSPVS